MNEAPLPSALKRRLSRRQRELLAIVVEGALLLGMIALVVNIWNSKHVTVTTHTVVVQASPRAGSAAVATPKASAVPVAGSMETVSFPVDSTVAGYKLSLQVPVAWRTVDLRSIVSGGAYDDYNLSDLAAILRFVPEHTERATLYPAVEPVNELNVVGTSHWATVDDGDPGTPANKQAYLAYVSSLTNLTDISSHKCTAYNGGESLCNEVKVKPQIVQTADGSLSGLAFLYMPTQSVEYDPEVLIELAGTVSGKPMRVYGQIRLYDQQYTTLGGSGAQTNARASDYVSKVTAARKAFAANPPADTLDMYARVVAVVKSMRFDKK